MEQDKGKKAGPINARKGLRQGKEEKQSNQQHPGNTRYTTSIQKNIVGKIGSIFGIFAGYGLNCMIAASPQQWILHNGIDGVSPHSRTRCGKPYFCCRLFIACYHRFSPGLNLEGIGQKKYCDGEKNRHASNQQCIKCRPG